MHCWTGDVALKARRDGEMDWRAMYTFVSDDRRSIRYDDESVTVAYEGDSENPGGLRGIDIEERFELAGGAIVWTIDLKNTSGRRLKSASSPCR